MAYISGLEVTATSTGLSDHIHLGTGWYSLHITSSGWGEAELQSASGKADRWSETWVPDGDTLAASTTKNTSMRVPGNTSYRLNVISAPNSIRMEATPIDS